MIRFQTQEIGWRTSHDLVSRFQGRDIQAVNCFKKIQNISRAQHTVLQPWTTNRAPTFSVTAYESRLTSRDQTPCYAPWKSSTLHDFLTRFAPQAVNSSFTSRLGTSRDQPTFLPDPYTVFSHGLHHKPWTHQLSHGFHQAVTQTVQNPPLNPNQSRLGLTSILNRDSTTSFTAWHK